MQRRPNVVDNLSDPRSIIVQEHDQAMVREIDDPNQAFLASSARYRWPHSGVGVSLDRVRVYICVRKIKLVEARKNNLSLLC
jgi:hypothetical protein